MNLTEIEGTVRLKIQPSPSTNNFRDDYINVVKLYFFTNFYNISKLK